MFRTISRMFGYSRGWRGWTIRPTHVFRAGFLTSAISAYPVAAYFGLVPQNISSTVQWFTGAGAASTTSLLPGNDASSKFGQTPGQPPSVETVAKDIVNKIEHIGAQAVANTLHPNSYPTSAFPNNTYPSAGYPYNSPGYAGANYGNGGVNYGYAPGDIACYFSPGGGCTEAIVNEIRQARQQIFVLAYSFTSVPIANALVEAHNRGVAVYIVLDKSQKTEQYSGADFVAHAGIPTLIDSAHAIAHNKVMLIDHQTIITGSFNFTKSAEQSNAENLLIIRGRADLYQAYENDFRHHYEHSQPYQGRGNATSNPAAPNPTRSYMPATNYAPHNYPANNNYAAPYGYPPSNNFDYGPSPYPQTASPHSYAPTGYRY